MAKDKKAKHKKEKDKKRKRDDEDEAKQAEKARKLAKQLEKELRNGSDAEAEQRFVWGKRIEKQIQDGKGIDDLGPEAERRRREQRLVEIEKVRKRREEYAAMKVQMEEEKVIIDRERAVAEGRDAEAKEEEFHFENMKLKAQQRIREGRQQPVDPLAVNLFLMPEFDASVSAPHAIFIGLTLSEVEDVRDEIMTWQSLDYRNPERKDFWDALMVVADAELKEARKQDEVDRARLRGMREPDQDAREDTGVQAAVDIDVQIFLTGKSHKELVELEAGIEKELESGTAADPEFMSAVLKRLTLHKAKARLKEIHQGLLAKHAERIIATQDPSMDIRKAMGWHVDEAEPVAAADAAAEPEEDVQMEELEHEIEAAAAPEEPEEAEDELAGEMEEEENTGQWSPKPLEAEHAAGQEVVTEEEDLRLLDLQRAQVRYRAARQYAHAARQAAGRPDGAAFQDRAYQEMLRDTARGGAGTNPMMSYITDAAPQQGEATMRAGRHAEDVDEDTRRFQAQSARLMGDMKEAGDAPFGGEVELDSKVYWLNEKYKPRKPKYFNRVHTGYEWNKYNQTHYDQDNPPPKVVQGYKFNIFYPDLMDKETAPEYVLGKDPNADEHGSTCLLIFKAGPPYEDIAFKILNKEWEYSHKKGFKSTFERGILHLYFNFKRNRYRR
ncbi:hypothetical protein CVIRNUC_008983 [Coccomyxa viridis]|uniref:Splicing factor Cactin n=1 Tax=Coccomyxa viridis TaxID=1274662 RepID=A0AAV1IHT4_9CHLO|nr:hypothetical protein CVIRNUC_008983 [Coccomyxa viridis]